MNVLAFDIETVPDTQTGSRLYDLAGLDDGEVARVLYAKRREQTGDSEFLPLHLHRIVAISAVMRHADTVRVWSLGSLEAEEKELVERFFDGIERFTPTLVSWNGGGFDLPVLHYRSLLHSVPAPRYWDVGEDDRDFKWNNYLNRFHWRHTDLMDVLAGYQPRGRAPLDQMAVMLGFPGKMGMHGSEVWDRYRDGKLDAIRNYCETDVLNTYLIYLRWQLINGSLSAATYQRECTFLRTSLEQDDRTHIQDFLQNWPS